MSISTTYVRRGKVELQNQLGKGSYSSAHKEAYLPSSSGSSSGARRDFLVEVVLRTLVGLIVLEVGVEGESRFLAALTVLEEEATGGPRLAAVEAEDSGVTPFTKRVVATAAMSSESASGSSCTAVISRVEAELF